MNTMTTLRSVLEAFEEANGAMRLDNLSRKLEIDPGTLDNMIQYWIRKGRIRSVGEAQACHSCGVKGKCPFVIQLPRYYELVASEQQMETTQCHCCERV